MTTLRNLVLVLGALLLAVQSGIACEKSVIASTSKATTYCPMIYNPVMAITRDGRCVQFTNFCLAEAAGAKVVPPGMCGFRSSTRRKSGSEGIKTAREGLPLPWPFPW